MRVTPRERDLTDLSIGEPDWSIYHDAVDAPPIRPSVVRLPRVHWHLEEVATYLGPLRAPRTGTVDDDASWEAPAEDLPAETARSDL